MRKNKKVLFFFTNAFPYGHGEQFIFNELAVLAEHYEDTYIFPLHKKNDIINFIVPQNVSIIQAPGTEEYSKSAIFKNFFLIAQIIISELRRKNGMFVLKNFRLTLVLILKSIRLSEHIRKQLKTIGLAEVSFYSNWMNEWSLALAILYKKRDIGNFTFKMRGFDLFDERREQNFMPFRNFIFKNSTSRLTMSNEGVDYLKDRGYRNVVCNYPGISMNEICFKPDLTSFTLVSCSNVYPIKRVELIAESLKHISFDLKWIHFGSGPDLTVLKKIVSELPSTITVELRGQVTNKEILEFYANNHVDCFIHLSTTEGFGYSIIEAFSSGIPAILYPGGAVKELIQEPFSLGLPTAITAEIVSDSIKSVRKIFPQNIEFRERVKHFCYQKFDKTQRGKELFNIIQSKPEGVL